MDQRGNGDRCTDKGNECPEAAPQDASMNLHFYSIESSRIEFSHLSLHAPLAHFGLQLLGERSLTPGNLVRTGRPYPRPCPTDQSRLIRLRSTPS